MTIDPVFLARPIAHRGLHDRNSGIIENTASAFERAIARNFAIECDLQLTGDDKPVVFHDATLDRLTAQSGAVRTLSAGQMGRIPLKDSAAGDCPQTFGHLLEQLAGRVPLVVELKQQADREEGRLLARLAIETARAYTGPLAFKSFDPYIVAALADLEFAGPRGIITYRYDDAEGRSATSRSQRFVLRHLLHLPVSRFTFVSCHHEALDLPAVRLLRARGFPVMTWTVRSPKEAEAARAHADQIVFEGFDPDGD